MLINEIKPGMVVALNSGSPDMTVLYVNEFMATCIFWNLATNQFQEKDFYPDTLFEIKK